MYIKNINKIRKMSKINVNINLNFNTLKTSIETEFQSLIIQYIEKLSESYDLTKDELILLWNNGKTDASVQPLEKKLETNSEQPVFSSVISKMMNPEFNADTMSKSTVAELKAICKQRGLKVSGTKSDIISRLMGKPEAEDTKPKTKAKPEPKPKTVAKKVEVAQAKVLETPVVKKFVATIDQVLITRNKFNRYEHAETGLVFNESRTVIGKQLPDGTLDHLTDDDIDNCNAFKFPYELPVNLDHKAKLNDVVVKELDEDEELDVDDIEEEQLIEEEEEEEEYEEVIEEEEEEIEYE
jgi:hypothetical protein